MKASEIQPKKLVIFDIDDTLVYTQTKVHVVKDGEVVKSLNSHDFTHYKLDDGESFDFGDFSNAKEFFDNSKPNIPMMDQLKRDINTGNKVVMVTARSDFDDKELFLDTFRKFGVNMSKVHVYRAGNIKGGTTEQRKKQIIKMLLDKDIYNKAIMYDDAKPNLHTFMELKKDHPRTRFYAWHVSLDGKASEYMRENIGEGQFRSNDIEEFKPSNDALNDLKSKYLPDWEMLDHKTLQAKYVAQDHREAEAFVRIINQLSEKMDHFCEVTQDVAEVAVKTTTFDVKGLTILDFQIAMVIDKFANDVGIKQVRMSGNFGMHEAWSKKYKSSINCSNPKGFSQKAHCAGRKKDEDQHPNERPQGPETKPTMPKGTVKVDVSDVYDWYKLGQHISDLGGLGKHDFGKGPPSAIMSFGDEDLEHEYIKALQKTGLSTTDIDPVDPKQPKKMKRQKVDPTYNVENFADGKNPGRKGLAKRSGVNTKASVSSLRKTAKNSSGEKQRMAHWLANMKAGKAKKK